MTPALGFPVFFLSIFPQRRSFEFRSREFRPWPLEGHIVITSSSQKRIGLEMFWSWIKKKKTDIRKCQGALLSGCRHVGVLLSQPQRPECRDVRLLRYQFSFPVAMLLPHLQGMHDLLRIMVDWFTSLLIWASGISLIRELKIMQLANKRIL